MSEYNTKAEGHKGEAARLEIQAQQLLMPAAKRKEIAAELRERAAAHWAKAVEAGAEIESIDELVASVAAHLS